MQNSITFMGPFIVQNSQQTAARRGWDTHRPSPPFRRYSQVFGHFLEGKRPGKCQTWPQYNEDLWTCLGLFEPLPATSLCTANCSYYYVLLCILQSSGAGYRCCLPVCHYNGWKSKEFTMEHMGRGYSYRAIKFLLTNDVEA